MPGLVTVTNPASNSRRLAVVLLLLGLAFGPRARAAEAAVAGEPLPPFSIELLYGEGEIYPSALASATEPCPFPPRLKIQLGDPAGLISALLVAPRDDCPVKVTIAATEIFRASTVTVRLPNKGQPYRIAPPLDLDHACLLALRHPIAAEWLVVTVEIDGRSETRRRAVRIHAINDCLTAVWMGGKTFDTAFLEAAYVNEYDAAPTAHVFRHALERRYVDRFDGYDSGSPEQVRKQAAALYQALRDLGCKYSSMTQASSDARAWRTATQRVRSVDDTLRSDQANCLDGTVLFASLFTQLRLRAVLFVIPYEHAFVGVYTTPQGDDPKGLLVIETTKVGYDNFDRALSAGAGKLAGARKRFREVSLNPQTTRELVSLEPAPPWQPGFFDYFKPLDHFRDAHNEARFYRIEVPTARAMGIVPLARVPRSLPQ